MSRSLFRIEPASSGLSTNARLSPSTCTPLDPVTHQTGSFRVRAERTVTSLGDPGTEVGHDKRRNGTYGSKGGKGRDGRDEAFTAVRSLALVVVVLWHWVFATVRWDAKGPHAGNPLHVVPGGFVLTWFLQVMPLFFLIGGWASWGSLTRHQQRGGSDRTWLRARAGRLAQPAVPLAVGLITAKLLLSPWAFGVVLLAASPLWFLGVYLPLTLLTPLLVRAHRRSTRLAFATTTTVVIATQIARFAYHLESGALTLVTFVAVWGLLYQVGFHLERLRNHRREALGLGLVGLIGIGVCVALGYPASMVAVKGEAISNMGPPTAAIAALGLFQAGLVTYLVNFFGRAADSKQLGTLITWVDRNQMAIYVVHLPLWVLQLVMLRSTLLGLSNTPTLGWLITRPIWILGPGYVLVRLLSALRLVPQPRHS